MSATYKKIEHRIDQTVAHMLKNPETKRIKIARQFDVFLQRLRFRLDGRSFKSIMKNMHERRLSFDQKLALKLYLTKMINFNLHSKLNVIKSAIMKLLLQNKFDFDESIFRFFFSIELDQNVKCSVILIL